MDAYIDPTTGAYVRANGDLQRDPAGGLANAIYLRMVTPLGSYWADPSLGSRMHELVRAKGLASIELRAQQYARAALQPLLDDGRASSIEIATQLQNRPDASKALAMVITVLGTRGERVVFNHHVPVA